VLSFKRELKRETETLQMLTFEVESNSAKVDTSLRKTASMERKVAPFEEQLSSVNQMFSKNNAEIQSGLTDLKTMIKEIEASQVTLRSKMSVFEEQLEKLSMAPPSVSSQTVIPLKRDKALAVLTHTEITVLEMLSKEGAKTAPEIKDKVQLSREHTARLMKKLYEAGYVERMTGKIPFKYNVKKEMENLMEKADYKPS
jgi:predicted HTH transcriptional regulator